MFTTNASRYIRGSTTKSKPRSFVKSANDAVGTLLTAGAVASTLGVGGASTFGVSVTVGFASTTVVVFNTALDAAGAAFLAGDLRVRRRVEVVVK